MIASMILPLLLGSFIQKWYVPRGIMGGTTAIMQIIDSDRDGHLEFSFTLYDAAPYLHVYELHLPDGWQADSFLLPYDHGLYGSGDFDLDGLYDFVLMFHSETPSLADGISIFESPDSFSYPTQEVWRDTVGFPLVTPICVYDIDQDGVPEIVKVCGYYTDLEIYEAIGNNIYEHITTITTASTHTPSSTLAFGDFDLDNRNEFVWGYSGGEYSIWECIGDNSYQEILLQQLPTLNIKDCFAVPDADGDGKYEFVVKGFVIPTGEIHAFIFEATGDNTYGIVKVFTLPGGDYYGGHSDVGDVDGDGIPEIALEGRQTVHIIKAAGNDSFYVWQTLPGNSSGSSVRVYDVDGNGLSEVIISGNDQTRIYEYQVGIAEGDLSDVQDMSLTISPNPFSNSTVIRCHLSCGAQRYMLKIYDIAGRLVTDLSGQLPGPDNEASVRWHAVDPSGRRLPAGVYFLEFQVGDYRTTEKLLLVR